MKLRRSLLLCASLAQALSQNALAAKSHDAPDGGMSVAEAEQLRRMFSPGALRDMFGADAASVDFAKLIENADVGRRQYDLYVNGRYMLRQNVEIYRKSNGSLGIRVPAQVLLIQPLLFKELPGLSKKKPLDLVDEADFDALIPGANVKFDTVQLRADIEIPRAWFSSFALQDDIVPSQRWTYGVPSAVVNYSANVELNRWDGETRKHGYLGLDARLSFNEWRLMADGSFSVDEDEGGMHSDFERGSAYVTRVFGESKTRIRAGEIYTQSFYQDALPILGVELYDDDSMMSSLERGYTPVVSGIAQTSARITVRQFGRIVFERNVQPGAFTFDNLPGLTAGTDLEVTIREQNGEERTFIVPYTQTSLQLRKGRVHYSAAVGRWRSTGSAGSDKPFVASGALGYGLPWDLTAFGGGQFSENYWNTTAGIAANLGLPGAISLQIDHAEFDLTEASGGADDQGERLRLQWTKHIAATKSYFNASWRRYLSGRYLTLSEVLSRRDPDAWRWTNWNGELKDDASLSFTQSLGRFGSWYLSGTLYRYEDDRSRASLNTSYTTNWKGINLSLSVQHDRSKYNGSWDERETVCFASVSIPLSLLFGYSASTQYADFSLQRSDDGSLTTTEGVNGTFGERNLWSYALSASQSDYSDLWNASISHESGIGRFSASVSHDDNSSRLYASAYGSLIATEDAVFPAQTVTGGSALIHVPDSPDARPETYRVSARSGDWLFITGLNNYHENEIALDPNTIPPNVMVPIYRRHVVPADDAVLSVEFETMRGWQLVAELRDTEGRALPFGAVTRLLAENTISTMDTVLNERSRAYFGAAPLTGVVEAVWSEKGRQLHCWAPYSIRNEVEANPDAQIIRKTLVCHRSEGSNDPAKRELDVLRVAKANP